MSDSMHVPRSLRRLVRPQPSLLLTPGEAEKLRAAVQRIIRASKTAEQTGQSSESKKASRR